jgi:hypothetical protein
MAHWALVSVSIAWALASDGDIAKAIKVPSKDCSIGVAELVHQKLLVGQNPKPAEPYPHISSKSEVGQGPRGSRGSGASIDETDMHLQ